MSSLLIRNARLVNPGREIISGDLWIEEGLIREVGASAPTNRDIPVVDARGRLVTPGLIDIHTHGVMHSLYEMGPEGLRGAARELGRFGVTTVVPTIVPQMK